MHRPVCVYFASRPSITVYEYDLLPLVLLTAITDIPSTVRSALISLFAGPYSLYTTSEPFRIAMYGRPNSPSSGSSPMAFSLSFTIPGRYFDPSRLTVITVM